MITWRNTDREWTERILAEYREMPGLRLTLPQAARLWALDARHCQSILDALVAAGSLRRSPKGEYCPRGDDEFTAPRPPRRQPPAARGRAVVACRQADREWADRILAEYREMPGLCLTLPQAARFWSLDAKQCQAILDGLVAAGSLRQRPNGGYCLAGDEESAAPRLWPSRQRAVA